VWRVDTGARVCRLADPKGVRPHVRVLDLAFARDPQGGLVVLTTCACLRFDVATWACVQSVEVHGARELALAKDARHVAMLSARWDVMVMPLPPRGVAHAGAVLRPWSGRGKPNGLAFVGDDASLVARVGDDGVAAWDAGGALTHTLARVGGPPVPAGRSHAFAVDTHHGSFLEVVRLCPGGMCDIERHDAMVTTRAWSDDDALLACHADGFRVRVVDIARSFSVVHVIRTCANGDDVPACPPGGVRFSPDATRLAVADVCVEDADAHGWAPWHPVVHTLG